MLYEVNLPSLSPTMEEGKIVKWIKKEKDPILSGEVLFEVETDKATMEYESPEDGYIAKIISKEGETANVNQLVAIISDDLNTIKSVKGIGLKTAQRVLIELKDKMLNLQVEGEIQNFGNNTIKDEALSALEVLGYSRRQSERIIDGIIQSAPDSSVEELIKESLNKL